MRNQGCKRHGCYSGWQCSDDDQVGRPQAGAVGRAREPSAGAKLKVALAHDARRRVLLVSDADASAVWEFYGSGWTNHASPSWVASRYRAALAYDVAHGYLVSYGGTVSGTNNSSTDTKNASMST